ncbi:MAG: site-2 protease family protein [Candidatus Omnitrophica bacterium]|nr:site-2 protease family protein [Candidatus Omnitrophota bacterium]
MLFIVDKLFLILAFLIAVITHEFGHGWTAEKLGDPTAREAGRVTFNPMAHIDPIGTVITPALLLIMNFPILFGWAKPVPVNFYNLNNSKKNMACVSLAGPAVNFLTATCAAVLLRLGGILPSEILGLNNSIVITNPFILFLVYLILINLFLGIFNLIPVPPLDGSQILEAFLPRETAWRYKKIAPYGIIIIFMLFYFTALADFILAIVGFIISLYSIH